MLGCSYSIGHGSQHQLCLRQCYKDDHHAIYSSADELRDLRTSKSTHNKGLYLQRSILRILYKTHILTSVFTPLLNYKYLQICVHSGRPTCLVYRCLVLHPASNCQPDPHQSPGSNRPPTISSPENKSTSMSSHYSYGPFRFDFLGCGVLGITTHIELAWLAGPRTRKLGPIKRSGLSPGLVSTRSPSLVQNSRVCKRTRTLQTSSNRSRRLDRGVDEMLRVLLGLWVRL